MRKFALAGLALVLSVGLTLAAEVTFLSYDKEKKELKVKDKEGDENTYTVTSDTKFKVKGKDTDKEMENEKGVKQLEKMEEDGKAKGNYKMDVETDGKKLKELTFKRGGKKKDKN